jgi:UDP-glucose 4-epimerase
VDEDALLPFPAHLYSATKLSGEMYCRSYARLYGLEPTILRFGIPYGPRARPAAVIPSFVDRALRGEPLTIAGDGDQERVFVYVEDLADGVVRALAPEAVGRTYNLAGRETTTIAELAEIVRQEVAPTDIVHTERRTADLNGATILVDRAERELGWRATTPLREGVRRYLSWLQSTPVVASPAAVSAPVAPRRVVAWLATAAREPVLVGTAALIALLSAALSVIIGGTDEQAWNLATVGLAFLGPIWTLTVTSWPAQLRRLQATMTTAAGISGVILLGRLSDGRVGAMHARTVLMVLMVSLSLTAVLGIVPRRLTAHAP